MGSMEPEPHPLRAGSLLVAAPMLADPNFRRSVVLLCEHAPEGSFGLVVNRQIDVDPGDLTDELSDVHAPVGFGGPVQIETLHYVHLLGDRIPGAIPLGADIWWGGDFDALQEVVREDPDAGAAIRFFLGYAGWGEGQLEAELEEGSWITAPLITETVMDVAPERMWRTVLRDLGGVYAMMANFPDDPRMN
jgi:putative transcriptional regulator